MKHMKLTAVGALLAANLFAPGCAVAVTMGSLPPEQTQGSISYVTGGVGKDEADAMKAAAAQYPLSLEFVRHAGPRGEFLANVEVTIKDRAGKTVLETTSDGPFLLAKVPAGKYTVIAQAGGQTRTLRATVKPRNPEHLIVLW